MTTVRANGHAPPALDLRPWPQQQEPPPPAPARPQRSYPWPLLLIAAPAAIAIWSGWVRLGVLCGFGLVQPFPGIASWHLDTAITLPVGIESYAAYALYVWLGTRVSRGTRQFARYSALGALALGCLGQVASHLLAVAGWAAAPWGVVVGVACLPVVTLSFAAALFHRVRADAVGLSPHTAAGPSSDTSHDTELDHQPDTADPPPVTQPDRSRRRQPGTSERVRAARVLKQYPGADDAEVMRRARVSRSTVQRARREANGNG